jgi:O-antigen/teichoic acid export membrane protein
MTAVLTASNWFGMLARMVGGIMVARWLDPALLGRLNSYTLVWSYVDISQLGVLNGLNRQVPFLLGKGQRAAAEKCASAAFSWVLLLSLLSVVVLGGFSLVALAAGDWMGFAGWLMSGVGLGLVFFTNYLVVTFRSTSEFTKMALGQIVQTFVGFAALLLVFLWAYYGQCLRTILPQVVGVWFLWRIRPLRVAPSLNLTELWGLMKTGLPIFSVGYLANAWSRLDAVLILFLMGQRELGLYQVPVVCYQGILAGGMSLGAVLYARMSFHYGESGDARAVLRRSYRPTLVLLVTMGAMALLMCLLVPKLITMFLPKYVSATSAAQWAMFAGVIQCAAMPANIFNVIQRQFGYALCIIAGAATTLLTVLLFWGWAQDSLALFPKAMAAGYGVFVVSANLLAFKITARGAGSSVEKLSPKALTSAGAREPLDGSKDL